MINQLLHEKNTKYLKIKITLSIYRWHESFQNIILILENI